MTIGRAVAGAGAFLFVLSCTRAPAAPTPAPAPGPTSSAQPAGPTQPGVAVRRPPPSRDSLAKLRAIYVAQITQKIAGRESQPAEQVFENVQVLKGITAAELVRKMDKDYAEPLGWNCTNCHRFAQ